MFKITCFILIIKLVAHEASVIRVSENNGNITSNTPVSSDITTSTLEPMLTTLKNQDLIHTTSEIVGSLTGDEDATILIVEQTLLESEPVELIKTDVNLAQNKKSEKLLLLSTPKISEKSKQPEEGLGESEEEIELAESVTETTEETTSTSNEETTILSINNKVNTKKFVDVKNVKNWSTTEKTTKLFPINDTLYADATKNIEFNSRKIAVVDTSSSAISEEQHKDTINVNYGSITLEESEADYVLAETEFLQGSYIDVDSELHLQPIVQSVEIVPTSLDDSFFLNYFQIFLTVSLCSADNTRSRTSQFKVKRNRFLARQETADDAGVTPYPSADELKPEVPFDETVTTEEKQPNQPDEVYGPPEDEVPIETDEVAVEDDQVVIAEVSNPARLTTRSASSARRSSVRPAFT